MQPWLPTALISISLGAVGQFLLKLAARGAGPLPLFGPGAPAALARLALNPFLLLGLVCFVCSMVLWVKVLGAAQLSSSYPLVSLGYVIVAVLSWTILGERLGLRQVAAIAIIMVGVALLGRRA